MVWHEVLGVEVSIDAVLSPSHLVLAVGAVLLLTSPTRSWWTAGRIPEQALSKVGNTGHRLWAPAADALESMIGAARRDGVKIGITDSYRPYAEHVDLVRRKGLYSQGGLAA